MTDSTAKDEAALEQFESVTDPYDLRDALGDPWGEKVLVRVVDGSDGEYYAAAGEDSPINIRIAWMEYYDEPVWVHRNRPGYELKSSSDSTSWEIRSWEDTPVKTDWEVLFP